MEHIEDLAELVIHLLGERSAEAGLTLRSLRPEELELMARYPWPGNVRELNNCIIYYIVYGTLPPFIRDCGDEPDWEQRVGDAMVRHRGNVSAVARELGKSRTTIYRYLKKA